jgi:hypothetical protein
MNKQERKKVAQSFKAAKAHLARNSDELWTKQEFICLAMMDTSGARKEAGRIILDRLGKDHWYSNRSIDHTVESWLEKVAKVDRKLLTGDNLQEFRHRWVDALIKEFSK